MTDLTVVPPVTNTDIDVINPNALPLLDGQSFDVEMVTREIHHHTEAIVVHAFQIGRLLNWSKECLRHGQYEEWVDKQLPFSMRTAQNYMRVNHFLEAHPALLKPLAAAGLKKTLLLTTLPPDALDQIDAGMQVPEFDLESIADVPYIELKKQVAKLTKDKEKAEADATKTQQKLDKAANQLLDFTGVLSENDAELVQRFRQAKEHVQAAVLSEQHLVFDQIAFRFDELSPIVKAEAMAYYEWLHMLCEHECLRFRMQVHDVPPAVYDRFVKDDAHRHKTTSDQDFPEGRRVPYWDEENEGGANG